MTLRQAQWKRGALWLGTVAGDVGDGAAGEGHLHEPLVVEIDPHPGAAGDPEGVARVAGAGPDFRLGGARRKHPVGHEADLAGEPPDGRLVPIDTGGDRLLIDRWHRLAESSGFLGFDDELGLRLVFRALLPLVAVRIGFLPALLLAEPELFRLCLDRSRRKEPETHHQHTGKRDLLHGPLVPYLQYKTLQPTKSYMGGHRIIRSV